MKFMERNPALRSLIADGRKDLPPNAFIAWTNEVMAAYTRLAVGLPDTSAWKTGKIEHVVHGAFAVRAHAELFGLRPSEVDVIVFLVTAHDLGRLVDEHRREKGVLVDWRHGRDSAEEVSKIFGEFRKTPLGVAVLTAIELHSNVQMPTLAELGGDEATHALTALVRDCDKMAGYDDAERYVSDPAFKTRQILTNFKTQRIQDPTWGDEKGRIEPPSMLDTFLAGKPLDRRSCQSYEAYMLQYWAWLYDVQTPEVVNVIIARGGPGRVLSYLLAQLKTGAPEQHERLYAWATTWHDGLLLSPI